MKLSGGNQWLGLELVKDLSAVLQWTLPTCTYMCMLVQEHLYSVAILYSLVVGFRSFHSIWQVCGCASMCTWYSNLLILMSDC